MRFGANCLSFAHQGPFSPTRGSFLVWPNGVLDYNTDKEVAVKSKKGRENNL